MEEIKNKFELRKLKSSDLFKIVNIISKIGLKKIKDCIFETVYDSEEWKFYGKNCNITRWLYIDDLLPKKGGER